MTRHPLAIARDEFLESEEGKRMCDLSTIFGGPTNAPNAGDIHRYFRNRIEAAFIAGWNARIAFFKKAAE
jgi:hypothetical protein